MNRQTDSSTTTPRLQAKNVTLPLLQLDALGQQLFEIGEAARSAKALCEINYDEIDALRALGITGLSDRIEAVIKATHRNVVLIEESLAAASLVLEEGAAA